MTIRVAAITEDSRMGGPQNRLMRLSESIRHRGVDIEVLYSAQHSDDFAHALKRRGIRGRKTPLTPLGRGARRMLLYALRLPYEILSLRSVLARKDHDLAFVNGGSWQIKGILAARLAGVPVVWFLNDTCMPLPVRLLFRLVQPFASAFIANGRRVREYYLDPVDLKGRPVHVIQSGTDLERFSPQARPSEDFRYPGLNIVMVGNVNALKGIEDFMDAAARVTKKTAEELSFIVVGPVLDSQRHYFLSLRERLEQSGLKNFHFHGPTGDVPGVLARTDIFVLASHHEASPNALWEAMACGRAVVTTDVADARDIMGSDSGMIVPAKAPDRMAEALLHLINTPSARKKYARNARKTAEQHLSNELMVEKFHSAFTALVKNTTGTGENDNQ